jgi:hypothetical protein
MGGSVSPDGKKVAAINPQGKLVFYSAENGAEEAIRGVQDGDRHVRCTANGETLLVAPVDQPNEVFAVDLASGQRKAFRTMPVPDGLHAQDVSPPIFSPDLKSYVYSYTRIASDLYVVEGLR